VNLYLLLSIVTLICFGLQTEPFSHFVTWQLNSIQEGQWWRIVTGNFTHTNYSHLAMNILGLWVISYIFKPTVRSLGLLLIVVSAGVGFSLLLSNLPNYMGLSGTLHGLFAFYSLQEALSGRKSSWLLVIGVIIKVVSEQWLGAPASTANFIQARVATEAHLAGLTLGLILSIFMVVKSRAVAHSN